MAQLTEAERRFAIRQEIRAQVPEDIDTHTIRTRILDVVMHNGAVANGKTALELALEAANLGDVRATAVALSVIPEWYTEVSMERRGLILMQSVHIYRDLLLDSIESPAGASTEMREAFVIAEGAFTALRDIYGQLDATGIMADPYRDQGSRRGRGDAPQLVPSVGLPPRRV